MSIWSEQNHFSECPGDNFKWDKVFKNGTSNFCGRQPLKIWRDMVCLNTPYPIKFFKGCLPQVLLGLSLNTLSHFFFYFLFFYFFVVDNFSLLLLTFQKPRSATLALQMCNERFVACHEDLKKHLGERAQQISFLVNFRVEFSNWNLKWKWILVWIRE